MKTKYMLIGVCICILFIACTLALNNCTLALNNCTPALKMAGSVEDLAHFAFYDVAYVSDMEQYGHLEYWASPEETMASMQGDCEDRAILFMRLVHDNREDSPTMRAYMDATWQHGHVSVMVDGVEYGYQGGNLIDEWTYQQVMDAVGYTRD